MVKESLLFLYLDWLTQMGKEPTETSLNTAFGITKKRAKEVFAKWKAQNEQS